MIYGVPEVSWDLTLMLLLSVPNSQEQALPASLIELYNVWWHLLCALLLGFCAPDVFRPTHCGPLGLWPLALLPILVLLVTNCNNWGVSVLALAHPQGGWGSPDEVAGHRRSAGSSR